MDIQDTINNILIIFGGRNKLSAMIGATNFSCTDENRGSINFKFKGNCKCNTVKITLDKNDKYTVKLYKIGNYKINVINESSNIFGENLVEYFEHMTGLRLSL